MNTIFKQILSITALTSLAAPLAHALVDRHDRRCVSRSVEQVHAHLVNYINYKNLDDGLHNRGLLYPMHVDIPLSPSGMDLSIPLINMTFSDPTFRTDPANPRNTDAIIWVVLQPYTLSRPADRYLLPRFFLHCRTVWDSQGTAFNHTCQWITPPYIATDTTPANPVFSQFLTENSLQNPLFTSFGVGGRDGRPHSGFHSELRVEPMGEQTIEGCSAGQSRLTYSFQIEPNGPDIQRVQPVVMNRFIDWILGRWSSIPGIRALATEVARTQVAPLFDENNPNNFYGWYYSEFYNAWANSIP